MLNMQRCIHNSVAYMFKICIIFVVVVSKLHLLITKIEEKEASKRKHLFAEYVKLKLDVKTPLSTFCLLNCFPRKCFW